MMIAASNWGNRSMIMYLAVLLGSAPATVQAQPVAASVAIQPALDTAQERQALRKMTACIAEIRPRWARTMLSHPYLSDAQASAAAEVVSGHDNCLGRQQAEVAFRTSGVVGSVAEYFVRADLAKTDPARLANALATVAPLNVSEDFALCLAARNPTAALDLAFSDPGSAGEAKAANVIGASLPSCTKSGEQLEVDLQSLRALVATALYRGMTKVTGPRS